jgi:hypothetical protein
VMSSDHTMRPPMVCAKVPRYRDLSIDANLCVCGGGWVCVGVGVCGWVCLFVWCVCVYIYMSSHGVCYGAQKKKIMVTIRHMPSNFLPSFIT